MNDMPLFLKEWLDRLPQSQRDELEEWLNYGSREDKVGEVLRYLDEIYDTTSCR